MLSATTPLLAQAQTAPVMTAAPRGAQLRDVLAKLSPQAQQIFRNEWLRGEREATPQRKAAAQAAEEAVFAAMAAEPYNAGALRRAYENQRMINANNQRQRQEHLVEVLGHLSPADRQAVVAQLRQLREQRGFH